MTLEIISPQKTFYSGEITFVKLPGIMGSFGIKKNHAPLVSILGPGRISVTEPNGAILTFDIEGGVAEVANNKINVLLN
jgi:F-type H+-transporting ATPase subunit epsilon